MSVSTILRTVAGRPARTVREELHDLESRLENQLDRAVAANGVLRQYLEERGLMDEFMTWQTMQWRDRRR